MWSAIIRCHWIVVVGGFIEKHTFLNWEDSAVMVHLIQFRRSHQLEGQGWWVRDCPGLRRCPAAGELLAAPRDGAKPPPHPVHCASPKQLPASSLQPQPRHASHQGTLPPRARRRCLPSCSPLLPLSSSSHTMSIMLTYFSISHRNANRCKFSGFYASGCFKVSRHLLSATLQSIQFI